MQQHFINFTRGILSLFFSNNQTFNFFQHLRIAIFLSFVLIVGKGWGQYSVNFEGAGETKTAYASGTVSLSAINWNMTEALIGTEPAELIAGSRSARLRGYGTSSMTMLANKSNGLGTISFSYRRYGTDTQVDWKVEYSTDDGSSWTQIGSSFTAPANNDIQTFSEAVNVSGDIRVRIKRATESGTSNRRLNIDDIVITDNSAASPTITLSETSLSGFSYIQGSGPSSEQTFQASATNLTNDISIVPSTNYEISLTSGGAFSATNPITLTQSGGNVGATNIYVRLKAGLTAGDYNSETITASSAGATNKTVVCHGKVYKSEPTNQPTAFACGSTTHNSIPLSWTDALAGASSPDGYLIKWSTGAITAPMDGVAEADGVGVKNITYGTTSFTASGLLQSTTYNFQIWSYTNSGTNINYKLVGSPTTDCSTQAGPCGSEDFSNIPTGSSTSYQNRSWTGTDGVTWTATEARTDETMTGKAICFNSTGIRKLTSPTYANGMGTLTFNYVRAFTGTSTRSIQVWVNGTQIGSDITVSATSDDVQEFLQAIDIDGDVVLEIRSTGSGQVKIDNISWTCYNSINPTITVTPITLSGFNYLQGFGPSAPQSFTVSGVNLTENILLSAPTNYEISTSSGSGYGTSLTITQTGGTVNATTIYVRLKAGLVAGSYNNELITASSLGANSKTVLCNGTVTPTTPTITVSPVSLTNFNYIFGNGPSAQMSFTVSGIYLTGDISIAPPTNYEISITSGGAFSATNPIVLAQTAGEVSETTIYVRLKAGLDVGYYNYEEVVASSAGAVSKNVDCFGWVSNAAGEIIPSRVFEIINILVDGCAGGDEGKNEMVLFQIGPNDINISDLRVDGAGNTGTIATGKWPNTSNSWLGIATPPANAAAITTINATITSCGYLIEPTSGILPAGKKVLMITSTEFGPLAHSFVSLQDTLYVIFQVAGNTQGHFANYDTPSNRTFVLTHTSSGGADTVVYNRSLLVKADGTSGPEDGAAVEYTWSGNPRYYNNGCQAAYSPLDPSWSFSSSDMCESDGVVDLTALVTGTPGGTWSGTGVSGFTFDPTGLSGTISITYTVGTAPCDRTETHDITVNAPSTIELTSIASTQDQTVCLGSSIVSTVYTYGGSASGVTITNLPAGLSSTENAGAKTVTISGTPIESGIYTISTTGHTLPCSEATIQGVITVNPLPNAGITNNTATTELTCSVTSISVTATGGDTYSWSGGSTPTTANNNLNSAGTYTVTVTGANGCTSTSSITITQDASVPTAVITNNTGSTELNCTTTSISVTASGGDSYAWSGGTTTGTDNNSFSSPDTYIVTVTASSGCTSTASIVITQNITSPTAGITNNTASTELTCTTTSISVTATGGDTYSWSGGSSTGTANNTFSSPDTYYVTVTGANGCTSSSSIIITQNITPPTAGITNNTASTELTCTTTSISVTATPAGASSYLWSGGSSTGTANNTFASPDTYYVTVTGTNGCTSSASIVITQDIHLPTIVIDGITSICVGESTMLVATGGVIYNWNNLETNDTIFVTPISNTSYTVSVTGLNGCISESSIDVFVYPIITPSFNALGPYCVGATPDLLPTISNNGIQGNWIPSTINTFVSGSSDYVFVPNAGQCAINDTLSIIVNENVLPAFNIDTTYCLGDLAQELPMFSNNGIGGVWNPSSISTNSVGTINYTFTPDGNVCSETHQINVVVYNYPNTQITVDNSVLKPGEDATIYADGADSYLWESEGEVLCIDCHSWIFESNDLQFSDSEHQIVITSSSNGCSITDTVRIIVIGNSSLIIPEGFSPNNDGYGDYWVIQGLENFTNNEISIHNRWGNVVYQAAPYRNDWKGDARNGNKLPSGTYYYVLKPDKDKKEVFTGYVYINY